MQENDRLKKSKPATGAAAKKADDTATLPNVEEIKAKFMDRLTSQLESIFEESAPSQSEKDTAAEVMDATKNSSLDEKDKLLTSVKQTTDKIRQELGELIANTW